MSGDTRGWHSSPCLLSVAMQGSPEDLLIGPAGSCPSSSSPLCFLPLIPSSPPKLSLSLHGQEVPWRRLQELPFMAAELSPVTIQAIIGVNLCIPPGPRPNAATSSSSNLEEQRHGRCCLATRSANSDASSSGSRLVVPISFRFRSQPRASIAMAAGLFVSPQ